MVLSCEKPARAAFRPAGKRRGFPGGGNRPAGHSRGRERGAFPSRPGRSRGAGTIFSPPGNDFSTRERRRRSARTGIRPRPPFGGATEAAICAASPPSPSRSLADGRGSMRCRCGMQRRCPTAAARGRNPPRTQRADGAAALRRARRLHAYPAGARGPDLAFAGWPGWPSPSDRPTDRPAPRRKPQRPGTTAEPARSAAASSR
jgi:hypothetical protein